MKQVYVVLVLALCPAVASAEKTFTDEKDITWDCGTDPEVTITTTKTTVTLTGACTSVTANGGEIKLAIEGVDELVVNGDKNAITAGTLGEITINGTSNKATWKKAKTGTKPKVHSNGTRNSVTKAKAAAAKPAPKKT